LVGVTVPRKPDLQTLPQLQQAIQDKERVLNGTGRILVRYSGTEPLLRVMVEGEDSQMIREIAEDLITVVKSCIQ
jgi:phosphoglucosamine mutase